MTSIPPSGAELRRRFDAVISGEELDELRAIASLVEGQWYLDSDDGWEAGLAEQFADDELVRMDLHPRLYNLIGEPVCAPTGWHAQDWLDDLHRAPEGFSPEDLEQALAPIRWFLDRAVDDGIPLTAAGYLRPADVAAASRVLPRMAEWFGRKTREMHAIPLLQFRHALQSLGLLRKYKNRLVLTRAGMAARTSSAALVEHLARRLIPGEYDFRQEAVLLILAHAAVSRGEPVDLWRVAQALGECGWRHPDGEHPSLYDVREVPALVVLYNLDPVPQKVNEWGRISRAAAYIARRALVQY